MKVDLIASKSSSYGRRVMKGDALRVSPREARILVALGHASYPPKKVIKEIKEPKETKGEYQRRDMTATPRGKRAYEAPPSIETIPPTIDD